MRLPFQDRGFGSPSSIRSKSEESHDDRSPSTSPFETAESIVLHLTSLALVCRQPTPIDQDERII